MSMLCRRSILVASRRLLCDAPKASQCLTLEQVKKHQENGSALLIDVREPRELKDHGMVNGAINIPVGYVQEAFSMDQDQFQAIIGTAKPDQEKPLIFFCVKGIRAKNAADLVGSDQFKFSQSGFYPGHFSDLQ